MNFGKNRVDEITQYRKQKKYTEKDRKIDKLMYNT